MTIDWTLLALDVAGASLFGLVIFHAVGWFYHYRYYVKRRDEAAEWKCQPERFLPPKLHRQAIWLASANMTIGGVITGIFVYAIQMGLPTRLYFDVGEMGWTYTILSAVGYFLIVDAGAYYVHRALHFKPLFKRIHRHHHRYVATTPFAAVAMHPVELMSLQAAAFAAIFVVPLHPAVIGVVMIYILIWNIVDHSGVKLDSIIAWQPPSAYHDDHHVHFHVHFGQPLMLWDRIHGTLRVAGRQYGKDIFGGRGVPMPAGARVKDDGFSGYRAGGKLRRDSADGDRPATASELAIES